LSIGLATDILIAASISFYLARGRQGFRKTDSIIRKLTLYTISTGVITAIVTLVTLILGVVFDKTFLNTISYFSLPKCYVNSFLAFLNVREHLIKGNSATTGGSNVHMSTPTALNSAKVKGDPLNRIELGTLNTIQFTTDPDHTGTAVGAYSSKHSDASL